MPFFEEDLDRTESAERTEMPPPPGFHKPQQLSISSRNAARRLSDESIRTELCEGPTFEHPRLEDPEHEAYSTCSDRTELIERLKRGESPTWVPNRLANQQPPPQPNRRLVDDQLESIWTQRPAAPSPNPKPSDGSPGLLPAPTVTPEKRDAESEDERRLREGLNIERPRSALHSGDFTQADSPRGRRTTEGRRSNHDRDEGFRKPSSQPWLATSPPRDFAPFQFEKRQATVETTDAHRPGISSLSSSLSSTSFVYQPPTSPLVQSESHEDLDLPMDGINLSSSITRSSRRHTLMSSYSGSHSSYSPNLMPVRAPFLRQERTYPYQAHQPRRSLTSTPNVALTGTSPQTPAYLRSRRPSYSSESSPVQHASMVGSYEESILRGRMSTTPSKPLDFVAQIGVLGIGKCKPSLRCPAHVTLPFPAVFYSYAISSVSRSKSEDGPSPYVGQIDLENGLPNQEEEARSKRKNHTRAQERKSTEDLPEDGDLLAERVARDARRSQKQKRRSGSPRAPPGGSYRIPEKGQIQIIIKNPNKTAVKLFLVPYDLAGMEPGTKTFVRQRSYSAGPIIDNLPELKDSKAADRPTLRYLIHLHICCPSRGRYYLYKSIRVVFANRVPDGKERLQNEITLPDPRYTAYKLIRVMHPPMGVGSGPGASLAAEKAFRRRSSGFYFGASSQAFDAPPDGLVPESTAPRQYLSLSFGGGNDPVDVMPFRFPQRQQISDGQTDLSIVTGNSQMDVWSTGSSQLSRPTTQDSNNISGLGGSVGQLDRYDKLSKGDVGYGGNPFSNLINGNPGTAESLLSQRLRTLGVEGQMLQDSNDMEQ
ncbi:hypothetical protein BKA67DRAFT_509604 [Truncatella angustata]|uniref:Atos-like conserved domain-containing protein n=1 Tax=Truncatella angustata TaxID=152316 RepID=A0A9P9A403_9PEZI|nr:uncharacterized protein BKA67DRAFT_509604 [Truncatella angustata]KAH6659795.1 hypothetical protein BKA67DRAFT_509604 [Truncatella angustata]KAH8196582.1 hypothetical protein TruAng_009240 [Truncatella angustata]